MAQPKPVEITANDLVDYLATESDFAFEAQTVKKMRDLGFQVQHGGTYTDTVTSKPRQFDIRATLASDRRVIRLAIECKNLKKTFPLLVTCLPRCDQEAFQHVTFSINLDTYTFREFNRGPTSRAMQPRSRTLEISGSNCMYHLQKPVGKVLTQVQRLDNQTFNVNDSEVYGKWSQAISSAEDLVTLAEEDGEQSSLGYCFSGIWPVLIVPSGTLWQCSFDFDGNQTSAPALTHRAQLFVAKECHPRSHFPPSTPYTFSHLEILTSDGLQQFIDQITNYDMLIPQHLVESTLSQLGSGFDR